AADDQHIFAALQVHHHPVRRPAVGGRWLTGRMPADQEGRPGGFAVRPLTEGTWADLEELFGLPGGSIGRGCGGMFYRRTGRSPGESAPEIKAANKRALRGLVGGGTVPGLIGYLNGRPAGWISLGPREEYLKLRRSPVMKPVDGQPVWSVVCSYVARP